MLCTLDCGNSLHVSKHGSECGWIHSSWLWKSFELRKPFGHVFCKLPRSRSCSRLGQRIDIHRSSGYFVVVIIVIAFLNFIVIFAGLSVKWITCLTSIHILTAYVAEKRKGAEMRREKRWTKSMSRNAKKRGETRVMHIKGRKRAWSPGMCCNRSYLLFTYNVPDRKKPGERKRGNAQER